MLVDQCGFCEGDLCLEDATAGWVFVCQDCGRETVMSDMFIAVLKAEVAGEWEDNTT